MRAQEFLTENISNDMSTEDMISYLRQHHDPNLHPDYLDHINTFSKFVLTDIPVDSIKTELPGLDKEKVEQYKKMDFSKAPPIVMGDGYILDGYHRTTVAKALGIPTIKGYVGVKKQAGTIDEAILDEGATGVLYHYTVTPNALRILQSGAFELSSVTGNRSEEQYAPRGYPYFFSTTRSRTGDYHRYVGTGGVMFVLDGTWFSQRYPVKPIDYWDRAWQHSPDRTRESEDRVFAKNSTIPITGVRAVHVLLKEQSETRSPETRQILILAKRAGIPAYLYTDEKAWRLQDTRNALAIKQAASVLKGQPQRGFAPSRPHTLYLEPWLELIYKNNKADLTPRAEKLRHDLVYYGSRHPDEDSNLGVDMSNARKPNSTDYPTAVKINDYMRKSGFKSTVDLKNALVAKWDKIK